MEVEAATTQRVVVVVVEEAEAARDSAPHSAVHHEATECPQDHSTWLSTPARVRHGPRTS